MWVGHLLKEQRGKNDSCLLTFKRMNSRLRRKVCNVSVFQKITCKGKTSADCSHFPVCIIFCSCLQWEIYMWRTGDLVKRELHHNQKFSLASWDATGLHTCFSKFLLHFSHANSSLSRGLSLWRRCINYRFVDFHCWLRYNSLLCLCSKSSWKNREELIIQVFTNRKYGIRLICFCLISNILCIF